MPSPNFGRSPNPRGVQEGGRLAGCFLLAPVACSLPPSQSLQPLRGSGCCLGLCQDSCGEEPGAHSRERGTQLADVPLSLPRFAAQAPI